VRGDIQGLSIPAHFGAIMPETRRIDADGCGAGA